MLQVGEAGVGPAGEHPKGGEHESLVFDNDRQSLRDGELNSGNGKNTNRYVRATESQE
jgi:hypothetical protein